MISNTKTFLIGLALFFIPFLGVPRLWRSGLVITLAVLLILFSVKITLPKRAAKKLRKREKVTTVFAESMPAQSVDTTSPTEPPSTPL